MAYRFKWGEPIPKAVRRIAREQMETAEEQLNGNKARNVDEAIHEARKSIKKVRALLRLMRQELGQSYKTENTDLGEVARKLSQLRDQAAAIQIFDSLVSRYPQALDKKTSDSIRQALLKRKRTAEKQREIHAVLVEAAGMVRDVRQRVKKWPLETDGFPAIEPGLRDAFGRGHATLVRARKTPRPENYHEWRKRVKDHWYHVRLLNSLWTNLMQAREKSLHDLETWLGDDHNLVVLREAVVAEPNSFGASSGLERLLDAIDNYEKELRDNSLSLGERIYEQENDRQFTKRMKHIWVAWEHQPESFRQYQDSEKKAS